MFEICVVLFAHACLCILMSAFFTGNERDRYRYRDRGTERDRERDRERQTEGQRVTQS